MKIVLLPGLDGTGRLFSPLVQELAPGHPTQVVAYPAEEPMGYDKLEQWVRQALPPEEPFVLLAESFSGPLAMAIAASPPAGLRGLVLCATFARNPIPSLAGFRWMIPFLPIRAAPSRLLGWLLLGRMSSAAWRCAIASTLASVSVRAIRCRLRAVLSVDATAALASACVPVLYLRASQDRVVPLSATKLISETLPSTRVVSIDGPHFLLQANPTAAGRAIGDFLASIERP
ncbi:alpha/beta fold hydrolase [Ideonella sp. YS5]|uniref:alpha/beta fold hydrolase n=1 Tax=Ideonella sp. YS5 TaxID=3453714 RepID=UPI003EEEF976